ncbi:MAG: GatB/YqeY domain-containing protein [Rhodothermia bacterium]|nr:GatB/YqeY domain-containing protein [Rhodothermia bacterium]
MLVDRIQSDLKQAMRDRDSARIRTLRSIRAAIQQKEIENRTADAGISDEDAIALLQKQAKQRRDSIDQFEAADRDDLVATEKEELEIIEDYLPKQLNDDEIRAIVKQIVQEVGAVSISDMGKVMGPAMGRLRGKADGRRVNEIVRELLV